MILAGAAAAAWAAEHPRGAVFSSDWVRFRDAATDLEVYRLTDPDYASVLPAHYNRAITRNSAYLLFGCDRGGSLQAFRMDLRSGDSRQLTETDGLDAATLTLMAGDRSFCYFAGARLCVNTFTTLRERTAYTVPEGWQRGQGLSATPDGLQAIFVEQQDGRFRLRMAALAGLNARTVVETPFAIADAVARPLGARILYRQGDEALWTVNADGKQNQRLKLAAGRVGPAAWAPDGKTILYLNLPVEPTQLNAIREYDVEAGEDKLVAKTSQFAHFGFNRNTSVFVGASRNAASPAVLLLLRLTRREFTLCEHRASHPETVAPMFSPDAQRVYFQSDRSGKPAIYCAHVEKLVEKIEEDSK
jgi:oligogalacturonide lyase